MKKIVSLFIGLFAFWITPQHVLAAEQFDTAYDVQYAVSQAGTTIVTQKITLTNKQSTSYPRQFVITLDSTKIKDVIAYDGKGVIHPTIAQKDGKTTVSLQFNEHVVGIGKALNFWIRFENDDIVQKHGSIWEVNIPGIHKEEGVVAYTASLQVPPTLGPNVYMSPLPVGGTYWTKEQLEHGGVTAAYGTQQHMELTLKYFLTNPTVFAKDVSFALPSDTPYQSVSIPSIDPLPNDVTRDADGNYIAFYTLLPGQQISVIARVAVTLYGKPKEGVQEKIQESLYRGPQPFWETGDSAIRQIAAGLHTPKEIYDYVVAALSYDYTRASQNPIRKGAKFALAAPTNAVCMEFTDLFIALARAAGIPAREVVGFAYTNNPHLRPLLLESERLHTWPEYYDRERKIWIPVDPTWANTTGGLNYFDTWDFDHVAFAFHGVESDSPYPAGFYRKPGESDDIDVKFVADAPPTIQPKLATTILFSDSVVSGAVHKGTIVVRNTTGVLSEPTALSIQSVPVDLAKSEQVPALPPYGEKRYGVSLALPSMFTTAQGRIVATAGDATATHQFDIQSYSYYSILPFVCIFVILVLLGWITYRYTPIWKRFKRS